MVAEENERRNVYAYMSVYLLRVKILYILTVVCTNAL